MSMPDNDVLQRFLFEHSDVRGEIVSLGDAYRSVLTNNASVGAKGGLLGEFLAAAALLSATLKFDGVITLQAHPKNTGGVLDVLTADCTRHQNLRAIIRYNSDKAESCGDDDFNFQTIFSGGRLVITIDPAKGERYQIGRAHV